MGKAQELVSVESRFIEDPPKEETLIVAASALVGFLPAPIIFPIYPLELAQTTGMLGFIVSLLLGLLGAYVGSWLGRGTGELMYALEG